jgi:hypothetical protein
LVEEQWEGADPPYTMAYALLHTIIVECPIKHEQVREVMLQAIIAILQYATNCLAPHHGKSLFCKGYKPLNEDAVKKRAAALRKAKERRCNIRIVKGSSLCHWDCWQGGRVA